MITQEIQSLAPTSIVELFVLDLSVLGGTIMRCHAGTNELRTPVVWQGLTYQPLPIEASGFEASSKGVLPRPVLRVANTGGVFSVEVAQYDDLIGAKIIRKRTHSKYLDAVNFSSGINPTADTGQFYPDEIWFVDQKTSENKLVIEWTLASPFDLMGIMLPRRQAIQNSCPWRYRGTECGYADTRYYNAADQSTSISNDVCGKRLSSCQVRFSTLGSGKLPFGGFPGATQ